MKDNKPTLEILVQEIQGNVLEHKAKPGKYRVNVSAYGIANKEKYFSRIEDAAQWSFIKFPDLPVYYALSPEDKDKFLEIYMQGVDNEVYRETE